MAAGQFELLEHTADLQIRAFAATPEELLLTAARGLYAAIGELQSIPEETSHQPVELSGDSTALILREFLAELLYLFDSKQLLLASLKLNELSSGILKAELVLHPLDRERSVFYREVKAVTYHELSFTAVERDGRPGYEARILVDI